ncbi:MAG TPA: hypothetical protein VF645_10475 [Allosphingosinicella sp.]|jgi:hypothetical protein
MLIPLGACASFDGQPRAVITPNRQIPDRYEVSTALATYYGISDAESQRRFRDTVIGIYMTAADANYMEFRRQLSRQMKGSNFGVGLGLAALTGGASIAAERTANILSAGATGLNSAHGALSKEVYFEKALPALLAGIEVNRIRVRTSIMRQMSQTPPSSYSLTDAFADLAAYESAASLDSAIETITAEASEARAIEQARFDTQTRFIVGAPQQGLAEIGVSIRAKLEALTDDQLNKVADAIPVARGGTRVRTLLNILDLFGRETDLQKTQALEKQVNDAIAGV